MGLLSFHNRDIQFLIMQHVLPRVPLPTLIVLSFSSGQFNYTGLRIPVPSRLNIPIWRALLQDYEDSVIGDFLEFGWPLGYTNQTLPVFDLRTHRGALNFPSAVQDYLSSEISLGRVAGSFDAPPFPDGFVVSPLNTVAKRDSQDKE